jgi:protein-disulfide isomerase-like protein with CxxC motif
MLTVQALRSIYTALGGTATDITDNMTIPEALAKIAVVAAALYTAATTKELPTVTAADNGSVLKVANGKWAVGTDEIQA